MPPKRTVVWFSAAVAIAYALSTIWTGVRLAVDTPTYSQWADALIGVGFNFSAYLKGQDFVAPPIFYLLWITVVATLKTVLGSSWMTGVVVLNWLSLSLGAYAIVASVRRLTQSGASMLLAALLLLVAGDLLIFVPYVVSDLIFWAISTGVLACGVSLAAAGGERRGRGRTILIGGALIAIALMFRPVAIPLVAFWIVSIATFSFRSFIDRFATPILVLGVVVASVAILAEAYFLSNPPAWPIGSMPAMLTMVGNEARVGMFVHQASPPMLVAPAAGFWGFVRVTLEKLLFFITPWLPHYSGGHTMINGLFFLPGYGLSIAAISKLRRLPPSQQRAVVVLSLFVLFVSVFHAMTLVDSDHRYRLPVLPAIIMLASIGLESVRRPRTLASIVRAK